MSKTHENTTHDELVAEAISLIQKAEDRQIKAALEAAMNVK